MSFTTVIKLNVYVILLAIALILCNMGYDWQTIGYGLNPWIAYPIAAIILLGISYNMVLSIQHAIWRFKHNQLLKRQRNLDLFLKSFKC